ncbi:MAG: hypothetical protein NT030_00275 [Candidatus Saganbacteria bacterium]|nr:hypothetical protein [Candidatus Saganbacteria bacterium]
MTNLISFKRVSSNSEQKIYYVGWRLRRKLPQFLKAFDIQLKYPRTNDVSFSVRVIKRLNLNQLGRFREGERGGSISLSDLLRYFNRNKITALTITLKKEMRDELSVKITSRNEDDQVLRGVFYFKIIQGLGELEPINVVAPVYFPPFRVK